MCPWGLDLNKFEGENITDEMQTQCLSLRYSQTWLEQVNEELSPRISSALASKFIFFKWTRTHITHISSGVPLADSCSCDKSNSVICPELTALVQFAIVRSRLSRLSAWIESNAIYCRDGFGKPKSHEEIFRYHIVNSAGHLRTNIKESILGSSC